MSFPPKVIQVLTKLIDQHLQDDSNDDVERSLLIKCRQELVNYRQCDRNPLPLMYSRRQINNF